MTGTVAYIIRNRKRLLCERCTEVHEFITRRSETAHCDAPVAFSKSKAEAVARSLGLNADDLERPNDDTLVVLDDSARKLPVGGGTESRLNQSTAKTTLM
jgi:hypothetical protein